MVLRTPFIATALPIHRKAQGSTLGERRFVQARISEPGFLHLSYLLVYWSEIEQLSVPYIEGDVLWLPKTRGRKVTRVLVGT